ncbi:MAG: ABC transporter ATP-binding protein [bacterium]
MGNLITLRDITKIYDLGSVKVPALNEVSLEISTGEFIAIMGASGSGKSTLMNIIGCLDNPTSGEYYLDGINVDKLNSDQLANIRNKKLGFVFQSFNLLARTSALENVELPLFYNSEINSSKRKQLAQVALEMVNLSDRLDHQPNQLSGGQQQRVAIARALVNKPILLLADEPTGNLDSKTTVEIMKVLQELNQSGRTIILVTHEHDISEYAKRVVELKDGKIIKDHAMKNRRAD